MKSPFPGMDPYLENPVIWVDFHNKFMTYLCEVIAAKLPDRYDARLEEQIRVIDAPPVESGAYRPDLSVNRLSEWSPELEASADAVAAMDPTAVLPLGEELLEEVREVRIDIRRWPGSEFITTIELLSPWNKSGEGYSDFMRKRRAVLMTPVNWVEIDLLVGGERVPLGAPRPKGEYCVLISRATARPNAEIYSWRLRNTLPKIPIPLRQPDFSIPISLADVFAMTHERGRMDKALKRLPADLALAPLSEADRAWAAELGAGR